MKEAKDNQSFRSKGVRGEKNTMMSSWKWMYFLIKKYTNLIMDKGTSDKCIMYKINCKDCSNIFVEQSTKSRRVRVKELFRNLQQN